MRENLSISFIMDSMTSSVDFCKIPGKYGYKYPQLQELHKELFGVGFDDAHNSAADVEATLKCFQELKRRGIL
jgi:DNA polymerase III epsilon subunit-like protein